MTELRKRARRCPMCGMVNRPNVETCDCGFHFDDPDVDQGALLKSSVVNGRMMVISGILLTPIVITVCLFLGLAGIVGLFVFVPMPIALAVKGSRIVRAAKQGLLDQEALPKARLLKDRS